MAAYEIGRRNLLEKTGVAAAFGTCTAGCLGLGGDSGPDTSGEETTLYLAAGGEPVDGGPADEYAGRVVFERGEGFYGVSTMKFQNA